MKPVIKVFSEIGKLKTILVHRPSWEIENLTPELLKELLFDDIPFLKIAAKEHKYFTNLLEKEGVEVLYIEKLAAETFEILPKNMKNKFIDIFLKEGNVNEKYKDKLKKYFLSLSSTKLIENMIAGIKKNKFEDNDKNSHNPFILNPLPNLLFQRDPLTTIANGVTVNHMWSITRNRETIFSDLVFKHHPRFKNKVTFYYERNNKHCLEGGDILILNKETLIIGITQRTEKESINKLIKNLNANKNNTYKRIIILDVPKNRSFMHLDTIFTNIDYDKFLVHPFIFDDINKFKIYEITANSKKAIKKDLISYLSEIMKKPIKFIKCGDGDEIDAKREQWNDGTNVLTIRPGVVIAYNRNYVTNKILRENGITVLEIPSSELSRGRGGPRCMSMPLYREDL